MKLILHITLVLLLGFRPLFPIIEYVINYDYIANILCINKDKPELECNGKCHLAKEMAKAASDDSDPKQDKKELSASVKLADYVVEELNIHFHHKFESKESQPTFYYNNLYCYHFSKIVLQPPTLFS